MSPRSLRPLAKLIFGLILLLGLAGCGKTSPITCAAAPGSCCGPGVACAAPQYLFASTQSGKVLSFPVDRGTGVLGTATSVSGPGSSLGLTNVFNSFVYVSDSQNNAINGYTVDITSGALSPVAGSPFSLGSISGNPAGLAAGPSNLLYAANVNGSVNGFAVNPDGSLSQLSTSPFSSGLTPAGIVYGQSPQGPTPANFLYVANSSPTLGSISGYTINPSSGELTTIGGTIFTGVNTSPVSLLYDSFDNSGNGPYLYVALNRANQILGFSVDRVTGALTPVPGSPFAGVSTPVGLAQYQKFLFVGNRGSQSISAFTVDAATGRLDPVSGSPFPVGIEGTSLAVYSQFLYASQAGANGVVALSINAQTGALTPISGSPFAASSAPAILRLMF